MEAALGTTPGRLLVSGGGARSDLMMQIVADVFARPAQRAGVPDAAAVGAAICAAVGSGAHVDFEAAMAAMTRPGQVFEPVRESQDLYAELRSTFAALPEFTDPMFRRIAGLGGSAPRSD
jgi:xylulokinase